MKLTFACALAVALCLASLAARSSVLRRQSAAARAEVEARAAELSRHPGEHAVALALEDHLRSRLQRLARR